MREKLKKLGKGTFSWEDQARRQKKEIDEYAGGVLTGLGRYNKSLEQTPASLHQCAGLNDSFNYAVAAQLCVMRPESVGGGAATGLGVSFV